MSSSPMMFAGTAWDVVLFSATTLGVGAACAPRLPIEPLLRFTTGVAVAIGLMFAVGFAAFSVGLPDETRAALVALVCGAVLIARRRVVVELAQDPNIRRILLAWAIFAAWALGLLALVVTYSGGGWVADWVEHWQRTQFFVNHEPLTTRFALIYPLTARPPLANLVIALWLQGSGASFAHFQVFMALFGTLVLLPACVFASRWRPSPSSTWWCLLAFMASPVIAQNVTFAWTKLPTAFFVLTALALAVAAVEREGSFPVAIVAAVCFALATHTHYSAVPWLIAGAAAYLVARRASWRGRGFWAETLLLALVVFVLLAPWVTWAIWHFGWRGTTEMNTTASGWFTERPADRIIVPLRNIFDTLVPFPWRGAPQDGLLDQASRLGLIRDIAFNVYQVNLPLAFGLSGFWVLTTLATAKTAVGHAVHAASCRFYWTLIPMVIVLGILVHTPRDEWGLAHICLQPLILLGLARISAALPGSSPVVFIGWMALAAVDVLCGIILQFGIESRLLARWITPEMAPDPFIHALSRAAVANANDKWAFHLDYFADRLHATPAWAALWLALCAVTTIVALRRARESIT